ncbi:transporter [Malikia spinosa]|uniref:Transporter n=1 Tax=Malikia spinosa TaxID=86180 RepID=A0A2S9KH92_9BURK|nr:transporter [Malikia spinosa]PRD69819.1 transporter [Malikia spinosa]
MKFNTTSAALALVATLAGGAVQAEGHYVTGVEGLQGSSVPPAGNYYLGYLVNYDINGFQAPDAKDGIGGSGQVTALANRLVHITDTKLFGADYGFETIIPVLRSSVKVGPLDASDSGVGDVYVGPLVLGWHGAQWDAVAAAGMWLDTASNTLGDPTSPGKGYQSTMLTGGLTYYFDQQKSISGSALFRYEYNGKKDNGVRPGDQLSLEWGLGKNYGAYSLGVVGYSQWQLSDDKGAGAKLGKAERHALGAELVYPVASAGLFLKGAAYKEFSVHGGSGPEPKGNLFRLSLVKPF